MTTPACVSVSPAYGRNYKTQQEAKQAFQAGKDFRVHTMFAAGTYCSIRSFPKGTFVEIRFGKQLEKLATLTIK